jgi:hypothetical protein
MGLMLFFRHFEEPAVSVASQPLLNSQFMHRVMDDVLAGCWFLLSKLQKCVA